MPNEEGLISIDEVFVSVEKMILLADGDRDHGNQSALTCNQSMVSLHLLRELKTQRDALLKALESLTEDPPSTLDEPDEDWEVIVKMRAIAREALAAVGNAREPS